MLNYQRRAAQLWRYIETGKPVQKAFVESCNSRLRDECLNVQVFFTVADARAKLEPWRLNYNRVRPHSALGDSAPEEFAHAWQTAAAITSSDGLREGLS